MQRGDELGAVSTKIIGIGKQLRDVREIFSTLRENLDQVMIGLGDGLLLFNAEGRAVLVSPSVEKFLGGSADELRGRRIARDFSRRASRFATLCASTAMKSTLLKGAKLCCTARTGRSESA